MKAPRLPHPQCCSAAQHVSLNRHGASLLLLCLQAAPHVAGVAVQILSRSSSLLTPASVHNTLVTDSTKNVIASASLPAVNGVATPNRMLFAKY